MRTTTVFFGSLEALWAPNHSTCENMAVTEDSDTFPTQGWQHHTGSCYQWALPHVGRGAGFTELHCSIEPCPNEHIGVALKLTHPRGGFCFGIWRRVTPFCCVLKAFCKRTLRCRGSCLCPPPQVPMPGAVFVLQCLLGMCWTWDRAKTGRKSWEILRGHNVGLKSWEIPPVNKRPRSTSYHNKLSLNRSTAWPRSKHPHGTTQEAWWMFHPTQAPKKPPQPKAVAPAWHRQVINPVLRDAQSVCAKQELGLAPARISYTAWLCHSGNFLKKTQQTTRRTKPTTKPPLSF